MQEENNINNSKYNDLDNVIDLRELFHVLLKGKWVIISITAFVSIVGVIYSLLLPNIYESKSILIPVNPSDGISGSLASYGGIVGLAGVSLPSRYDIANSKKAIKKISSLSFFKDNIMKNIYLPDLLAVKSWNSETNTIVYNESIYNTKSNTWVRDFPDLSQSAPSPQKAFKVFISKHLTFTEEKKTGFVTLSIKHQSPYVAKKWAELVVNEVNSFYRQKDKLESEKAVSYLNMQISMTGLSEIKQVLAQLMQEEIKKLTLVEANQFYVFDYIDPPAVMEKKSEPRRALICILSAILGGVLSILFVLIRYYAFNEKA